MDSVTLGIAILVGVAGVTIIGGGMLLLSRRRLAMPDRPLWPPTYYYPELAPTDVKATSEIAHMPKGSGIPVGPETNPNAPAGWQLPASAPEADATMAHPIASGIPVTRDTNPNVPPGWNRPDSNATRANPALQQRADQDDEPTAKTPLPPPAPPPAPEETDSTAKTQANLALQARDFLDDDTSQIPSPPRGIRIDEITGKVVYRPGDAPAEDDDPTNPRKPPANSDSDQASE